MFRAVRLVAVVAVLLLSGCDDSAPEPTSTPPPEGLRAALVALYTGDHADDKTKTDATCVVDHFLDSADQSELTKVLAPARRVPDPLPAFSKALAEAWTDGVFACTDFADSVVQAQVEVGHGKVAAGPLRKCLDAGLSTGQLREAYLATLMQKFGDPSLTRLQQTTKACVDQAKPGGVGR
jgi:hypothetical protein